MANRSTSLLLMDFSVGLLKCKSFIFFNDILHKCQMMVWNLSLLSPTNIASVYWLPAEFRNRAGIYPFFAWTSHFLLPRPMLAITYELCYASQCFFCLIRWISKLVAVQKLVVFFKKKTNSFSNILWNCFIHFFIFKPNVSRILLLLSSNFDM